MTASLKRRLARIAERLSGAMIVHPAEIHQVPERQHLRRFFKHFEVDAVFDVGANEGQYAAQLREEVGFEGHIVSFEPVPELATRLSERSANDPRWHIEAMALDREAGPATFNVMASTVFSSLHQPAADQPAIFAGANAVARQIDVMRGTLADVLPAWQKKLGFHRPFLKMDTQGNDLAVFEGAGDWIRNFIGLQSELSYHPIYSGAPALAETLKIYEAQGFRLSAFVPNTAGHFPDLYEVDCIMYRTEA